MAAIFNFSNGFYFNNRFDTVRECLTLSYESKCYLNKNWITKYKSSFDRHTE